MIPGLLMCSVNSACVIHSIMSKWYKKRGAQPPQIESGRQQMTFCGWCFRTDWVRRRLCRCEDDFKRRPSEESKWFHWATWRNKLCGFWKEMWGYRCDDGNKDDGLICDVLGCNVVVLYCTWLYWTVMHCNGLKWAVLDCTGLYWAILGCTGKY